jgi:hypothetical protein
MSDEPGDALAPYVATPEIVDRAVAGSVRVLTLRSPFTLTREERYVPEGSTLANIIKDLELEHLALCADEGVPREGPSMRLGIAPQASVPLTYLESPFVLGHIENLSVMPAGCLDDTVGECLIGVATMASTRLADIVWPAITSGRLRGLCVEVQGVEREGRFDVVDVLRVQLGARANDCLRAAHVVRCWEGDDAAPR